MSLYSFYRISKPSEEKIASEKVEGEYKRLRGRDRGLRSLLRLPDGDERGEAAVD